MEFSKELNEYYLLSQAIEELEIRIKYLETQLYVSPSFDKVGISSSQNNVTEDKYINLLAKKEQLQQKKNELAERKLRKNSAATIQKTR